jgi:hypothetical protein
MDAFSLHARIHCAAASSDLLGVKRSPFADAAPKAAREAKVQPIFSLMTFFSLFWPA